MDLKNFFKNHFVPMWLAFGLLYVILFIIYR
jgi:hypothetical protein